MTSSVGASRSVESRLDHPHSRSAEQILERLNVSRLGLTQAEAAVRLQHYGPNALPKKEPPGILQVFMNQFKSPLCYS